MRASGPVAIRTGTLIRKTGCRGPLGTVAARCVIRWNRGKPYLLRTFFIRSEEALASANWPKPGSMEARLALMIWLKVSFFMMFPFGRPPVFLLLSSSASCGASLLVVFLSLYLLLFFCCAFTIGRKVCVRHAAIAISIVDSSVHLKERIKKRSYILLRSLPKRRFKQKKCGSSAGLNANGRLCVVLNGKTNGFLSVSTWTDSAFFAPVGIDLPSASGAKAYRFERLPTRTMEQPADTHRFTPQVTAGNSRMTGWS